GPVRDTTAARATGSGSVARVHDVIPTIDVHCALVGGIPRIDRHAIERVIDDVILDTWIGRPTIDSDIRVATTSARLLGCELRRDRAVSVVGLARVSPLVANTGQEIARHVPISLERGSTEGGDAAVLRSIGPKFPGEVVLTAATITRVLRAVGRHGRVAVERWRATAARGRASRTSGGLSAAAAVAAAAICLAAASTDAAAKTKAAAGSGTTTGATVRHATGLAEGAAERRATRRRCGAARGSPARARAHPSGCSTMIDGRATCTARASLARRTSARRGDRVRAAVRRAPDDQEESGESARLHCCRTHRHGSNW